MAVYNAPQLRTGGQEQNSNQSSKDRTWSAVPDALLEVINLPKCPMRKSKKLCRSQAEGNFVPLTFFPNDFMIYLSTYDINLCIFQVYLGSLQVILFTLSVMFLVLSSFTQINNLAFILSLLLLSAIKLAGGTTDARRSQVLLLSFDGFRWDYLSQQYRDKYQLQLPNFDKLQVFYL